MFNSNILQQLQERESIVQLTNEKELVEQLQKGPIVLYCGFDPTADSLHVGHLVPLICLKRFQQAGHKPIVVIGGATGMIGDPSFKATERKLNSIENINNWVKNISNQIKLFLNFDCGSNSAIIVNNYDWFGNMDLLSFLRNIGKYFSVNQIINRDAVKQRLNREGYGISFTEFSYNLLQAYDFAELHKRYGVVLQIGGTDQWGNIIAGIELTRRLYQHKAWGLTLPLITKFDGTKFGKTEQGSVWLDAKKTSPYKFYQFWINTADADVYRLLKLFSFMYVVDINDLELKDKNINQTPQAQYILAEQITRLVHGELGLIAAKRITHNLFYGNLTNMTESDFEQLKQDGMPVITLSSNSNLQQALIIATMASSRSQARTMISSNAITINGKKQSNIEYSFSKEDKLFKRFTLLRRGKKFYCLINWQ
ncbi:tyrosine--tRNA ligase [Pantoea sp. Mhis]|uniref:tyrosine--tRNA ligase n=1 Tax=Pantoea sp. Mhis TaxID=2576759 RepID=UPI00135B191C|nr:tyrosine--tRNA ligase [Pantoea sp. Mhis]MXP56202.1 tyrosine--tRNA ligase [Pantoea sp. Mhis]